MVTFRSLRDALGRALAAGLRAGRLRSAAAVGAAPAAGPEGAEHDEFAELLDAVGAEPGPDDAQLALRDATIAGLQEQLGNLRDLGDRLAQTEQMRLSAEEELERLRSALPAEWSSHDAAAEAAALTREALEHENAELRSEIESLQGRCAKLEERIASWRDKADERHRTAADRWHEIRKLRGERRELEQTLARERQRLERLQGPVQTLLSEGAPRAKAARARLIDLMRPETEQ